MFVVDHCFKIGSEHKVCQDYATSGIIGNEDIQYGIVTDGCSSSKNVDIGSRILALATRSVIESMNVMDMSIDKIHRAIISEINRYPIIDRLISECSMDSTLVFFIANASEYRVLFFGDGSCYLEEDGNNIVHTINYGDNAPPYISYSLEKSRELMYYNKYGKGSSNKIMWNMNDPNVPSIIEDSVNTLIETPYFEIRGHVEKLNEIAIFSDGISSFRHISNRKFIDTNEVIMPYVTYPIRNGVFVLRNFNAQDKSNMKNGIEHIDDLSCASMIRRVKWEK